MIINAGGFVLRPWRVGDERSLVRHANDEQVWQNLLDKFPNPYTPEEAQKWIKHASSEKPISNFAIEVNNEAVGGIGFSLKEDVYYRSAEIGYWLGQPLWSRGIMTDAVTAIKEYVFKNFDVCRIYAGVFEWNTASMRVLEKAGFEKEACLKKSVTKNGRTVDQYIYAFVIDDDEQMR